MLLGLAPQVYDMVYQKWYGGRVIAVRGDEVKVRLRLCGSRWACWAAQGGPDDSQCPAWVPAFSLPRRSRIRAGAPTRTSGCTSCLTGAARRGDFVHTPAACGGARRCLLHVSCECCGVQGHLMAQALHGFPVRPPPRCHPLPACVCVHVCACRLDTGTGGKKKWRRAVGDKDAFRRVFPDVTPTGKLVSPGAAGCMPTAPAPSEQLPATTPRTGLQRRAVTVTRHARLPVLVPVQLKPQPGDQEQAPSAAGGSRKRPAQASASCTGSQSLSAKRARPTRGPRRSAGHAPPSRCDKRPVTSACRVLSSCRSPTHA